MRVGEKRSLSIELKSDAPLGMAVIMLRFDPKVIKVNNVSPGSMFAEAKTPPVIIRSIDDKGMLLVSITPGAGSPAMTGQGMLLQLDVEALCAGDSAFTLDPGNVHLVATDGRSLMLQMGESHLTVKQ